MRLMAVLAAVVVVPFLFSGCLRGCDDYIRTARWNQEDVPLQTSAGTTNHHFGDHWGTISRNRDTNRLHLSVFGNESVSHDELVDFAETLFASEGWPPPRLEGAEEYAGCGDHY